MVRPGDYYFVMERILDGRAEGLAGVYDVNVGDGSAEWGRFVLRPVHNAPSRPRCSSTALLRTVESRTRLLPDVGGERPGGSVPRQLRARACRRRVSHRTTTACPVMRSSTRWIAADGPRSAIASMHWRNDSPRDRSPALPRTVELWCHRSRGLPSITSVLPAPISRQEAARLSRARLSLRRRAIHRPVAGCSRCFPLRPGAAAGIAGTLPDKDGAFLRPWLARA